MKYISLSLAAGFAIIGFHQVMMNSTTSISDGIAASYWLFMMSIMMLFWYQYLNKKDAVTHEKTEDSTKPTPKPKAKTGGKTRKKPKKLS
ncbi:MAG: hypothetical protein ACPGJS_14840 [Flammeovirgaceae bacterium]